MLNESTDEFTMGSRLDVQAALESIKEVLDLVRKHYDGSINQFQVGREPGAERLIRLLALGVAAEDKALRSKLEQFAAGEAPCSC